jgi:NADH:ubiquinone oxidoreductase subunit
MWAMYCRTLLRGKKVGTDPAGNRYYRQPAPLKLGRKYFRNYFLVPQDASALQTSCPQEKRWVLYSKSAQGAAPSPCWESWLRGGALPSPLTATESSPYPGRYALGSVSHASLPVVLRYPPSDNVWTPPSSNVKYQASLLRD